MTDGGVGLRRCRFKELPEAPSSRVAELGLDPICLAPDSMLAPSVSGTVQPYSSRENVRWQGAGKTGMLLETPSGIHLRARPGDKHLSSVMSRNLPTTLAAVGDFSPVLQPEKLRSGEGVIYPKFHSV